MFCNRRQKPNEPIEVYAAEVKKFTRMQKHTLVDDNKKRENLLRKFVDGRNDERIQYSKLNISPYWTPLEYRV